MNVAYYYSSGEFDRNREYLVAEMSFATNGEGVVVSYAKSVVNSYFRVRVARKILDSNYDYHPLVSSEEYDYECLWVVQYDTEYNLVGPMVDWRRKTRDDSRLGVGVVRDTFNCKEDKWSIRSYEF